MNIILVGNPNVGKSVIFNSLTGSYVTVSNYPGTTVDISRGGGRFALEKYQVIDTPGVNSLTVHSEDEKVTRDILSKSDVACIVQVADSKNLKRSLVLTLELIELGLPLVLDLNMSDEAMDRGIKIDVKKLSDSLGIGVVETVAVTGEGIGRLKDAITKARVPDPTAVCSKINKTDIKCDSVERLNRRGRLAGVIAGEVLKLSGRRTKGMASFIGKIAIRPMTGIPILILTLVVMYFFVGRFAAVNGVDFLENKVFGEIINPFLINIINELIPYEIVKEFLIGDYGIITMALTYAFAIIFPIVTAFFLFFGVLEDSGYLPRLSVLSDRLFKTMGLNGRAILPMVLGLGCGTMATLTARILDTKKEKILVSLLLTLAIPCSAQLGVIMGLLGSLSLKALFIWVGVLVFVMMLVGFGASKIIPGARSEFIQEIPPMRMPQIKNIVVKTGARLKWYLMEAAPLFVLGTALLFVLDKLNILKLIEKMMSPLVVVLLGLPQKATDAFILGFLRRDYGAAGLYALSKQGFLDGIQILVSLVVITLFVPCVAQFFVTVKERGLKIASIIGAFVFISAFLVGGFLNFALRYLSARGIAVI